MPALKKFRCHVACVDACVYYMPLEKSWAFASTSEDMRFMQPHTQASVHPRHKGFQRRLCQQTLPNPLSPFKELSKRLSHWLQSSGLRAAVAAHILQQKPDCPSPREIKLRGVLSGAAPGVRVYPQCRSNRMEEASEVLPFLYRVHKQVKVKEQDQGLLLFEFAGKLYGYGVCHFGARFSAYWWQRLGALLLRVAHQLAQQPHRAWLYVDDLLAALLRSRDLQLALLVVLFVCLKSPISWKKAALGDSLVWCSWKFNFRSETVSLEPDKLAKLADQIQALLACKKVDKKALPSCLGLLNWATSISQHLRSHTATLYSDLNSRLFTTFPLACGNASFSAWTTEPWSPGPYLVSTFQPPPAS